MFHVHYIYRGYNTQFWVCPIKISLHFTRNKPSLKRPCDNSQFNTVTFCKNRSELARLAYSLNIRSARCVNFIFVLQLLTFYPWTVIHFNLVILRMNATSFGYMASMKGRPVCVELRWKKKDRRGEKVEKSAVGKWLLS